MKKNMLNKAISLMLVLAFIVGLLPMTARAGEIKSGTYDPATGNLKLEFGFQNSQYANINVYVKSYDDSSGSTKISAGAIASNLWITGAGDLTAATPEDGYMEAPHSMTTVTDPSVVKFEEKGIYTTTKNFAGQEIEPTEMMKHYLEWDGTINGYQVIGPDMAEDRFILTIELEPLGNPTLNEVCIDDTDADGNPVHTHGKNYTYTHRPDYKISTDILIDFRDYVEGGETGPAFIMIDGSVSDSVLDELSELFFSGSMTCSDLMNYPTLDSLVLDSGGLDPVNMVTGALNFTYQDLRLEGSVPLTFLRAYNSRYGTGSLGQGFTHGYEYSLRLDRGMVRVTIPGGDEVIFIKLPGGGYDTLQDSKFTLEDDSGGYVMTHKDGAKLYFTSTGQLTRTQNPDGVATTLTYNASGQLTNISGLAGSYTLGWDSGHITSVTDSASRTVSYIYSGNNLTSFTNADGSKLTYTYDSNGYLASATDFDGEIYLQNTYDSVGRVTNQVFVNADKELTATISYDDAAGITTCMDYYGYVRKYHYDTNRNLLYIEDEDGTHSNSYNNSKAVSRKDDTSDGVSISTNYEVDANGNVTKMTYADGSYDSLAYNSDGRITQIKDREGGVRKYLYSGASLTKYTDARGNETNYTYTSAGLISTITDALGHIKEYKYDTNGRVSSITDAEGGQLGYDYDSAGRIISSSIKLNASDTATTSYEYSDAGKLIKVTDALGNITTYTYNGNGFTTSTKDALNNETSTEYGTNGQQLSTTDALGNKTVYAYNKDGLLSSVTDPEGNTTKYTYNAESQLIKTTDASNNETIYEYDSLDSLVKTTDALGNSKSYTYDSMGRTKTVTDENSKTTTYTYDLLGRLKTTKDALGNETNYTYDLNGNLLTTTDANGVTTSSEYNELNYTVKSIDGENKATIYEYDKVGRLTKTKDALGGETSYTYDLAGNMLSTTDPNGNTTNYTYDLLGRQTKHTNADGTYTSTVYDALGRVLESYNELSGKTSFTYDKNGNVLTTTDPKGNVTTQTYNKNGQVVMVTYADNGKISYTYTPTGSVKTMTDQLGNVTTNTYDALGRAKTVTDATGGVTEYFFDSVGNVTKTTKDGYTVSESTYDDVYRVLTDKDGLGNAMSYTYDKIGNVLTTTDRENHTTTNTYDKNYRLTQTIDALGNATKTEYDALGRTVKAIDANGNATAYTYDKNGNVLTTTDALKGVVTSTYDSMNRALTTEDKLCGVTAYVYDKVGRVKTMTDAVGKAIGYVYDANGNLTQLTNRENEKTNYGYDSLNRQIKETNQLNHSTETVCDLAGNVTKTIDGNKNVTVYTYDGLNRILTKTDAEGSVESYTYNYLDKVAAYTANSSTTTYVYDAAGNLTSETSPLGNVTEYTYDKMGNVASKTDENNKITTYVYDALYRLTSRTDADGTANYTYDKSGNILTAADSVGTVTFVYDVLDRPTSIKDTDSKTVGYTYDAAGNRLTTVYPDGKAVTNTCDTLGRVATLMDYDGKGTTYTRDAEGKITKAAYSDGSTTEYDYNAAGLLIQQKEVDKANSTRREIIYGYDDAGNLKSEQRTGVDVKKADQSVRYYYDKANKLTSTVIEGVTTNYSYDISGNLLSDGKYTYTYDKQNRLLTKMGADGTTTYSYDAAGNLTKKTAPDGATTYTYNAQNRLVKGEESDGSSSTYTYNALGVRTKNVQIRENVNAGYGSSGGKSYFGEDYTQYLDDGRATDQPTWVDEVGIVHQNNKETVTKHYTVDYLSNANRDIMVTADGQYTQRYVYDENGTRISAEFDYADNTHPGEGGENPASDTAVNSIGKVWYRSSLLGSTLFAVDKNGDVVSHTIYDPWGNPLTETATDMNQSGLDNRNNYTGYTWDETLDLYYAQNRFYDASTHRFTQEDPVKDGANWYVYCGNNPTTWKDSTGEFGTPIQWACAIVGGIVGWYFGDYVAKKLGYTEGCKYWAIRAGVTIGGAVIGWFAGTLILKIATEYLSANPTILAKIPTAVKWFLGLSTGGAYALSTSQATQIISAADPNKITHIMPLKHAWDLVCTNDWASIKTVIQYCLVYGKGYVNNVGNIIYEVAYKGQTILVDTKIVNGVNTLVDAWVKTR